MKKVFKLFLVILVLITVMFGLYLYKLHTLAVEGNEIFEQRCLKVNPLLIDYKNSFLKFADYLQNPEKYSSDEANDFFDGYIDGMRNYITEENKWLEMQQKHMDRWDFRLIGPWYIKQAMEYEWKMYEGYRDNAEYLLVTFDQGEPNEDTMAKQQEIRNRRDKYTQLYRDFFDEAGEIKDWRKMFISVPIPKGCTDENLIIPNTSGAIDWESESVTPSPALIPIDPNSAS